MPTEIVEMSREARRIYAIAIEVRPVNPARADRLLGRVRALVERIRIHLATKTVGV
jgi:hypothetical protein